MTCALVAINGEGHKHEVGPIRLWTRGRGIAAASLMRLVRTDLNMCVMRLNVVRCTMIKIQDWGSGSMDKRLTWIVWQCCLNTFTLTNCLRCIHK